MYKKFIIFKLCGKTVGRERAGGGWINEQRGDMVSLQNFPPKLLSTNKPEFSCMMQYQAELCKQTRQVQINACVGSITGGP